MFHTLVAQHIIIVFKMGAPLHSRNKKGRCEGVQNREVKAIKSQNLFFILLGDRNCLLGLSRCFSRHLIDDYSEHKKRDLPIRDVLLLYENSSLKSQQPKNWLNCIELHLTTLPRALTCHYAISIFFGLSGKHLQNRTVRTINR